MKVIIAGSRDILDYDTVVRAIDFAAFDITEVVSGKAPGVDTLGEQWANANGIPVKPMPAAWRVDGVYNRNAGFERNYDMAVYADALIAVWDGESSGTKDMISHMVKLKKRKYVYNLKCPPVNLFDF